MPELVTVISTYNDEGTIAGLVPQALEQEHGRVFVVDDASTDDTVETVRDFPEARLVLGNENTGLGENRNRILEVLGENAVLLRFLDGNVLIDPEDNPEQAAEILTSKSGPSIGFIGGLVRNPDGSQTAYNYGPEFSLRSSLGSGIQYAVVEIGIKRPELSRKLRKRFSILLEEWPNTLEEPTATETYWSSEANMLIPIEIFRAVGGNNSKLRCHEAVDLGIWIRRLGLTGRFDPAIAVTRSDAEKIQQKWTPDALAAMAKMLGEYGIKNYITGRVK